MITRQELRKVEERMLERIIVAPPDAANAYRFGLRTTSGTTGGAPLMTVMQYPPQAFRRYRGARAVLFCFGSQSLRLTRALQVRHHEGVQQALFLGARDIGASTATVVKEFAPDMVEGVPSFIARVCEQMRGATFPAVTNIFLFGERLSPAAEVLIREVFPAAELTTLYLSTEMGGIGYSCPHLPSLNFYHPNPAVRLTILHPDESGAGELLVSKKITDEEYIEDYETGDIVRMHAGVCACGQAVSFEHLGRKGHDYIKLLNTLIVREEFDRVARIFARYFEDYRAEVSEVMHEGTLKGNIILRVYRRGGPVTDALAEEIARDFSAALFLTQTKTMAQLVEKGIYIPLKVEFVAEPFATKNKDVKLSQLF